MRNRFITLLLLMMALLAIKPDAHASGIGYETNIVGVNNPELLLALRSSSVLVQWQDRPSETVSAIRRRAEEDVTDFITVLHNYGYYEARVSYRLKESSERVTVTMMITTGTQYKVLSWALEPSGGGPKPDILREIKPASFKAPIGQGAISASILEAQERLVTVLSEKGYPLSNMEALDVVVDPTRQGVKITSYISTGPFCSFGTTEIEGLTRVKEEFVRRHILWMEGDVYDPAIVRATEEALQGTQLFSEVRISHAASVDSEGSLLMRIELTERAHRSIGAGLSYTTGLGPGVHLNWEHRNVRKEGQHVGVDVDAWWNKQTGALTYMMPHFLHWDQELTWRAEMKHENTSFEATTLALSAIFNRYYGPKTRFSYGTAVEYIDSKEPNSVTGLPDHLRKTTLKFPLGYTWNGSDDPFDPTRGFTVDLKVTPATLILNENKHYVSTFLTTTYYQKLSNRGSVVLALKGAFGSIIGPAIDHIPAPDRIYSGTENTLRGYKYQTVSPLNGKEAIGGKSLAVGSAELRGHITDDFGMVLFYEAGNVYKDSLPTFNGGMLQSAGVGLRYFTTVGPARLDIAFPLNRRVGIDPKFQLYFSIGQTF